MPDGILDKCTIVVSCQLLAFELGTLFFELWPFEVQGAAERTGQRPKYKDQGSYLKSKPAAERRSLAAGFGFFRAFI